MSLECAKLGKLGKIISARTDTVCNSREEEKMGRLCLCRKD